MGRSQKHPQRHTLRTWYHLYCALDMTAQERQRFDQQIQLPEKGEGDCWLWTGPLIAGLPNFRPDSFTVRSASARRLAYEIFFGKTAYRFLVNCGTALCLNPDHLVVVQEHRLRKLPDTCGNGHDFSDRSLVVLRKDDPNRYRCRICQDGYDKKYAAKLVKETGEKKKRTPPKRSFSSWREAALSYSEQMSQVVDI